MSSRVVLFDMDGVLCDFVTGVLRAWGKFIPARDVQWEFGLQVGMGPWADPAAWRCMESEPFWRELLPLPDGMDLFARVLAAVGPDRVALLSDGSCKHSPEGKRAWLRRHLPAHEHDLFLGRRKFKLAADAVVLVDDYQPHVEAWGRRGPAVLAPRPWNARKPETDAQGRFDPAAVAAEVLALAG